MAKPTKFIFNPGDDIPAESFQTIDPDNLVTQSAGYLTGGTDVVLADFQTLGAGDNDGAFKINIDGTEYDDVTADLSGITDEDDIATALQSAIRTATSSTETVVWDTDHFVVTSSYAGRESSVLKFQAPTTGTDISGAGYLDLGANATEVAGDGDDYKLVRLDEDGKLPSETLDGVDGSGLVNTFPVKTLILTRDITADSGTISTAHGLSFTPKRVLVTAMLTHVFAGTGSDTRSHLLTSDGFSDGTNHSCIYNRDESIGSNPFYPAAGVGSSSSVSIYIRKAKVGCSYKNSYRTQSAIVTFDATNINIVWTKTDAGDDPNSVTGTIHLIVKIS
jgi:hypothetical protein